MMTNQKWSLVLRRILLCAVGLCQAGLLLHAEEKAGLTVPPDDARISYSDYVHMEFVPSPLDPAAKLARFDRLIDMNGKGYRWDNPGTRVRFRTNATSVKALLYFNELHISTSARNNNGIYLIDGVSKPDWYFHATIPGIKRDTETVTVTMNAGAKGFHDYELVMPYGDSIDFQGVQVNADAQFEASTPRPAKRYVAYGDSITHGFTSSSVDKSYAYLVAQKNGWQIINLGLGGRASTPADGEVVASLKGDIISVFMGANDWQIGIPPERYRTNMMAFFDALRAAQPNVPIYYITSLWVAPSWDPKGKVADLEAYRQVAREIVAARKDANLHIVEGPELIDHELNLFDSTPVHPNDAGFAQMGARLASQMQQP